MLKLQRFLCQECQEAWEADGADPLPVWLASSPASRKRGIARDKAHSIADSLPDQARKMLRASAVDGAPSLAGFSTSQDGADWLPHLSEALELSSRAKQPSAICLKAEIHAWYPRCTYFL